MDEDDDSSGTGNDKFAETLAAMSARYTTPEAKTLARKAFTDLYNERGQSSADEQAALNEMDEEAKSAKEALRAARQKIASQRFNEQAKWFSIAGALGQGSKSGRFGEELGRLGNVLSDQSAAKQKFGMDQSQAILENLLKEGSVDKDNIAAKLAAIKARRTSDQALMTKSLDVLGREIKPGGGTGSRNMSPFGKIASDEGLEPGTPAFTKRVQDLYNIDLKQKQQAAGLDVSDITDDDRQILAQQYGAPLATVDPFRGLSTKARQLAVQKSVDEGQKLISTTTESDNTARDAMRKIDRFMALNKKTASGPIYGMPGVGFLTGFSNSAQEMDTIRADMARKQRQPGEGQVSNFDAEQFLKATIGRGKSYSANSNIARGLKAAKQLQIEQNEFLSNYLAVNQHLQGAKESWNRYIEANPIFDPTGKQGNFDLNKGRIDYKAWFRSRMLPPPVVTGAAGDVPVPGHQQSHMAADIEPNAVDDELAAMTPAERQWATTPAQARGGQVRYAKGGKVASLKALQESPTYTALRQQIQALMGRVQGARNYAAPPPAMPATPPNSAMAKIASDKQSLIDSVRSQVPASDAGPMQSTSQALDLALQGKDQGAGMRSEQLWRVLQDMASKYKMARGGYAEGGEADAQKRGERAMTAQIARQLAQGAGYNWSDEALGSLEGDGGVRNERSALEDFSGDNPLSALGLQMAGAVPTGMAAGAIGHRVLQGMRGSGPSFHPRLGMRKGRAAALAALIERVLPKSAIGKMAVSGATSGAIAGAGAAQEDRGAGAGEGAVLGTVLGPLLGLSSKYGLGAARRGWDLVSGNGPRAADEKVLTALANDTTNVGDVTKRMTKDARMGVPSMIGDSAGKNTAALMEAVAGKSGRGPGELAQKLEDRQAGQGDRVENQINKALKPSEYFSEEQKLRDELYTNAKPLYEKAYKTAPPVKVGDVSYLYDSKAGRKAMKDAVDLMNGEGIPIGKKDFFGNVRQLSLQSLDYTKRALDDAITKEEGSGANYAATNRGRVLRGMRDKLRGILDDQSPDYLAARQQYAGDLEVLDALRAGKDKFSSLSPKQVENLVGGMSFAEKDAYRTGVAQTLFEAASKAPRGSNVAARIVGNPAITQKLGALFDSPKEAQSFSDALVREFGMYKQSQGAISNAARQRAGSAAAGLDDTPLAHAADMALDAGQQAVFLPGLGQNTGGPWSAARMMQWVRNKMPMSEQTANEVSDTLGIQDPKAAKAVIDRLMKEGQRLEQRQSVSEAVRRAATRAGAVAVQPDPWAQGDDEGDTP